MALSCSIALRSGLDLLDPEISEEKHILMVLDGSHALLPYAVDFWLDHLLMDQDETSAPILIHDSVGTALAKLEHRHRILWSKTRNGAEWTGGVIPADSRECLRAVPSSPVLRLCSAIMGFGASRKLMNAVDGRGIYLPTFLFSLIEVPDAVCCRI
jgi:hypothetical protein